MQTPRLLLRQFRTSLKQNGRRYDHHNHGHLPETTMNDLPQPKGSWQTLYDHNQQKYNRHLILGVLTFTGTLAFGQYFGFHRMYNDFPEKPAEIATYIVEE